MEVEEFKNKKSPKYRNRPGTFAAVGHNGPNARGRLNEGGGDGGQTGRSGVS